MRNTALIVLAILMTLGFVACQKDKNDEGTATLRIKLTDAPANYEEVNVDIQGVEIHSDADGWIPLTTNAGVYDLLDYVNGTDTLLASDELPAGTVSEIRLKLGNNNSIKVDGQIYPLTTPSAQQSGLKLKLHTVLEDDVTYVILLDFDAAKSVVETGNGKYILKPVIRAIAEGIDGVIRGRVEPLAATPVVYAINGTDTVSSFTNSTGEFQIKGLASGSYNLLIEPVAPYGDTTLTNISVTVGNVTNVGTIVVQ